MGKTITSKKKKKKNTNQGFLGGPGVGNPPANTGDAG